MYFPSADLRLKPSLAFAVAVWRSFAAVARLSDVQVDMGSLDTEQGVEPVAFAPG